MKKILLILLCLPFIGFAQKTYVPDDNFEQALINLGYDIVLDDSVLTTNINNITTLNIQGQGISNLTGIEAFASLYSLQCDQNQITNLNISNLNYLNYLTCYENNITNLNLGNNNLNWLQCWNNNISNIDLSNCTNLGVIEISYNNLTNLDLSNCSSLYSISIVSNNLTNLDLKNGNNNIIDTLRIENNPNLYCINVDDSTWSMSNWTPSNEHFWDSQSYFSNNCPPATAIQEHFSSKKLLKVTDLLGREKKGTKNEPLLYLYDDGTVEKRITLD